MTRSSFARLTATVLVSLCALAATAAQAVDLHVMNSGGFTAAYKLLAPKYEAQSGNKVAIAYGPSMGASPESIPNRLKRDEPADVVIMVGYALDKLIAEGKVLADSRVELADSRIGMAVRAGQPKPDISSVDSFKTTLLRAKSVAYSDSASGVYIQNELFKRMGIESQMKPKAAMIEKIPVGSVVAKGDYQLGFQQVSELLPISGIEFVGKIPESLQSVTRYAAGIPTASQHQQDARQLLQYLASPQAADDIARTGLDPLSRK